MLKAFLSPNKDPVPLHPENEREKHMGTILPVHCPSLSNRFKSRRFSRSIPTTQVKLVPNPLFRTGRDLSPGSSYPYCFSVPSASGYPRAAPDDNRSFRRNRSPTKCSKPCSATIFFENDFSGRRAADVAQTDKQDSVRFWEHSWTSFLFQDRQAAAPFQEEEFMHGKRKRPRILHGAEKGTVPLIQKIRFSCVFGLRQRMSGCRLSYGRFPSWIKF